MMTSEDIKCRQKEEDDISSPPGFVSPTSFALKWIKMSEETGHLTGIEPESIEASFQIADVEKL